MWIVTRGAFLSIVDKNCGPDELLVRARRPGDIEKVFPHAEVVEGGGSDYRCRAVLKRAAITDALRDEVEAVDYPNFKSEVARKDPQLASALGGVWNVLLRLAPGGRMG
jgi:hypothetical protein